MDIVKFAGQPVKMGDKTLIVPPLTFKQLKDQGLREKMMAMGSIGAQASNEQLDAARDVIYACVSRNYPDLSVETLDDMITMGNLRECLRALFGIEGPTTGELKGNQPLQLTGTTSIAS